MAKKTVSDSNNRDQSLSSAMSQIERQFGKGAIMRLGDTGPRFDITAIPSGCITLDIATGIGGYPKGRIVEIYGPESSGKTTLALHAIAQAQKNGGICAFIDAEHALDASYSKRLGVNTDELLISQPDSGEQALEIGELLVRSAAVDVIVIDSVAALVPRAELEGEMGDTHVGLQARLMSQALRKLAAAISKSMTCFIFINQIREKVGVMFGNPETTSGGRALKFYSSMRIEVRRISPIKEGTEILGNRTVAKIVKNKLSAPFKRAEFDIIYGEGISQEGSLLDIALGMEMILKSGVWFSYGETRMGQGRENAKRFLKENPQIAKEIETKIMESGVISNWQPKEAAETESFDEY
ncbi:recombinase RecA [bacterium]|nr:recombinase RecA [candidate division CSSED10-310 bacterium]